MALARFNANVFDGNYNLAVGKTVNVRVRNDVSGQPLASIFSDREGTAPLSNPFTTNTGEIGFHVKGGVYYIKAWIGSEGDPELVREWRYVGIGLGSETDLTGLSSRGAWQSTESYSQNDYVTHNARTFASIVDSNLNNEPPDADASDAFWQWIPANEGAPGAPGSSDVYGTSATSNTIDAPPQSKTWIMDQENRGWIVGGRLRFASRANPTQDYQGGVITAYTGNSVTVAIDNIDDNASAGPFTDWNVNLIGEAGEDGQKGDTGPTGVTVELDLTWNATPGTTPAAGEIMASQAPATGVSAALSISTTDRNGDDITDDIVRMGSSTTLTDRGEIRVKATGVQGQWFSAVVNGAPVFEADHYDIPVTFGSVTTTAIVDASIVGVGFARTGNAGSGIGDVVGPGSSTPKALTRFEDGTGKLIGEAPATPPLQNDDGSIRQDATSATKIPSGTTAQRPGTPTEADLRWNSELGVTEIYDGAAWQQVGGGAGGGNEICALRLSLVSGSPIYTQDVVNAKTLYAEPYLGGQISLYDGANWVVREIGSPSIELVENQTGDTNSNTTIDNLTSTAQLAVGMEVLGAGIPASTTIVSIDSATSITISNPATATATTLITFQTPAATAWDVHAEWDGSQVLLTLLKWTDPKTQPTDGTQDGVLVKNGEPTKRFLGSIYCEDAGETNDSSGGQDAPAKRYIWNAYNPKPRRIFSYLGSSGNYGTNTWRQFAGQTGQNSIAAWIMCGRPWQPTALRFQVTINSGTNNFIYLPGIGVDDNTPEEVQAVYGRGHFVSDTTSLGISLLALVQYNGHPGVGFAELRGLENSIGSTSVSWYSGVDNPTVGHSAMLGEVMQ